MRGLSVKPLVSSTAANTLLERILHAEGAIMRSVEIKGPTSLFLTLSVQDKQRGFDWIDMIFEMNGMNDARLFEESKLGMLDMEDGITIIFEDGLWGWGIGRSKSLSALKDAPLFVIGTSLKYGEAPFSG